MIKIEMKKKEKIEKILEKAHEGARCRKADFSDILAFIEKVENYRKSQKISKKNFSATKACWNIFARSFPVNYRGKPFGDYIEIVAKEKGYYLFCASRVNCNRKNQYDLILSESAKEALIRNSYFALN